MKNLYKFLEKYFFKCIAINIATFTNETSVLKTAESLAEIAKTEISYLKNMVNNLVYKIFYIVNIIFLSQLFFLFLQPKRNKVGKQPIGNSASLNQISYLAIETFKNNNLIIKENEDLKEKYATLENRLKQSIVGSNI